jgi:DNA-binding XRE family transcriptional regulator
MLPDHPWVLGRLFHAARDLLGWSQERVAAEAGVSMAVLHALEHGRVPVVSQATLAVMATLERSGVRFLAAADGFGHGVRYAATGSPEPRSASPGLQIVTGHGEIAATGPAGAAGSRQTNSRRRLAAAQARTARQWHGSSSRN